MLSHNSNTELITWKTIHNSNCPTPTEDMVYKILNLSQCLINNVNISKLGFSAVIQTLTVTYTDTFLVRETLPNQVVCSNIHKYLCIDCHSDYTEICSLSVQKRCCNKQQKID